MRVLTDGSQDEAPSFAPNGSMIIYATAAGNREVLAAVSVDGRFKQRLTLQAGNVRKRICMRKGSISAIAISTFLS